MISIRKTKTKGVKNLTPFRRSVKIRSMIKVVDLFAGCGGLSLGFQNASCGKGKFNIVGAYDAWKPAVNNYLLNFDHPIFEFDLSNTEDSCDHISKNFSDVGIIIGGPPCQDFSSAGKRSEGSRASLTKGFATIVSNIKPKWFLMENVARSRTSEAFQEAKKVFKEAGYGLTEKVLDASLCGAPQKRKRFFCVGLLGAEDGFLEDLINQNLSQRSMTVREYMGEELDIEHYYRHPRNYSRRGVFSIDEPAPTVRGVNRPVPNGYPGHKNDTGCVKTENVRALTTEERARLQTFPKKFKWNGSKTSLEQIIGNAVPVKLGEFMANRILEYQNLMDQKEKQSRDYSFSPISENPKFEKEERVLEYA